MKTAQDLQKLLYTKRSVASQLIDTWLEEKVFPAFENNKQGFSIPTGVSLSETILLLKIRGFIVTSHSDHQGDVVYISIPPQGE